MFAPESSMSVAISIRMLINIRRMIFFSIFFFYAAKVTYIHICRLKLYNFDSFRKYLCTA